MALHYTYEMEGRFYVGCLDDYPEYPTQGENLKDFNEKQIFETHIKINYFKKPYS